MPLPRITHKRRLVQVLLVAVALLLPFISISGNPFLRMDMAAMTLFLAGIPLRIDQFYLVLLVILLVVALFLLVTVVLGRVWCGWFCPQTVFNDLTELIGQSIRTRVPPLVARLLEHFFALIIAKLVAFNLFCWFMPPRQAVSNLLHFSVHPLMFATFLVLTTFGYLNLILVKRSFCRSYCPYGRFQAVLMDAGTLNISFLEENRDRCLRCSACGRNCPMGIDIRSGFQIECIGCGRCIDACRTVMERTNAGGGLIDYHFGTAMGTRFRPGATSVALLVATLLLAVGLYLGVAGRKQSAFAVQRVATSTVRVLPDGSVAQPWRATIGNRSGMSQVYSIKVDGDSTGSSELFGPVDNITVAANQHREITFMLHFKKGGQLSEKIRLQLMSSNIPVASATVSP